jgi:hypothetical protein
MSIRKYGMSRKSNTTIEGRAWTPEQIKAVWQKGRTIQNFDPARYRIDTCLQIMEFSRYGNRNEQYGWEIDHIVSVSNGGGDELNNLQPLNWKNNASKGDKLNWLCY